MVIWLPSRFPHGSMAILLDSFTRVSMEAEEEERSKARRTFQVAK